MELLSLRPLYNRHQKESGKPTWVVEERATSIYSNIIAVGAQSKRPQKTG